MGTSSKTVSFRHVVLVCLLAMLMVLATAWSASAQSELPPGGTFWDDDGNVHEGMIEAIVAEGITQGCTQDGRNYCPAASVTRGQMATFLTRALDLPPADRDYFPDDDGSVHEDSINRVAAAQIASGRPDGTFGPDAPVTRGQMATFLAIALDLPAGSDSRFDDVSGIHESNVNRVAQAEITVGCNSEGTLFCPRDHVTRGQMATFLGRALNLTATVPPPRPEPETISECLEPKTSAENVARCFGAAVAADDYDTAADVASANVIAHLQDLLQYGSGSLEFGSFDGCGEPLLGYPSAGLSCFFFDPLGSEIHGVTTELVMGQQDGQYFVEDIEFIG